MRRSKSKLVTYFLSFMPGLGFMYRGYMKKGFSCLTIFFLGITMLNWLELSALMVIPILFWFYAFFDQINTFSLAKEEQDEIKDEFIFQSYYHKLNKKLFVNNQRFIGILLTAVGIYGMIHGAYLSILQLLPDWFRIRAMEMLRYVPRLIISSVILYIGIKVIEGKLPNLIYSLTKDRNIEKDKSMLTSNVVYYMDRGIQMSNSEKENGKVESEQSILDHVSREQLLRKAKEILDDEVYRSIHIEKTLVETAASIEPAAHIETAASIEPAAKIEKAAEIEKPTDYGKVEVEKCPHLF